MMGCNRSRIYHEIEVGIDHKDLALTAFEKQRDDIVHDLETYNDQTGRVTVDSIFRPTREIYGQRAKDMAEQLIEWSEYGIKFQKRPLPHDFPAFAHEKPAAELAQLIHHSRETLQKSITDVSKLEKMQQTHEREIIEDIVAKK